MRSMKGSSLAWVTDWTWLSRSPSSNQQNLGDIWTRFLQRAETYFRCDLRMMASRLCSSEIHESRKYLDQSRTIHQKVRTLCSGPVTDVQKRSQDVLIVPGWRLTKHASVFFFLLHFGFICCTGNWWRDHLSSDVYLDGGISFCTF